MNNTLFITGASGYIGLNVVKQAVKDGWAVKGLVRSQANTKVILENGGQAIIGDATKPEDWISEVKGSTAFIDLAQPAFPSRMTTKRLSHIASFRLTSAKATITALLKLSYDERPNYFFISGADDLQPDFNHKISASSPLRTKHFATSSIGVPVRQCLEQSSLDVTYVYFGSLVYGPGKGFAKQIVPGLEKGKIPIIGTGDNRFPVIQVTDAARVISHIASLSKDERLGKVFLAMDGANFTQEEFLNLTGTLIKGPKPKNIPQFIVNFIIGRAFAELMMLDVDVDNSALIESGFSFNYPSINEGLPYTLKALGYTLD